MMQLHKFNSMKEYRKVQAERNKGKLKNIWASGDIIEALSSCITENISKPEFGICHGVRNGWEVAKFRECLKGVEVIGTEIAGSATQFKNVIEWDFHETKEEWICKTDFIYSNSMDHSYDPEMCLDKWMSCLKDDGLCFLEWSQMHDERHTTKADCFGASRAEYVEMITKNYVLKDTFEFETYSRPVAGRIIPRLIFVVCKKGK